MMLPAPQPITVAMVGTRLQPVLIDEGQFGLVHGIAAEADAEGIEHGLALGIGGGQSRWMWPA